MQERINARDYPNWIGIVGDWYTEYRADGRHVVHGPNGLRIDGRWRLDGDVLTINDANDIAVHIDTASARYRIRFVGDELYCEALRDECGSRRIGMTIHP